MTQIYRNALDLKRYWTYYAEINQSAAGGGAITAKISPGEGNRMQIIDMWIGAGTVDAARAVTAQIRDTSDTYVLARLASINLDSTEVVNFPYEQGDTLAVNLMRQWDTPMLIIGTDHLRLNFAALIQNDDFIVCIRAEVTGKLPAVTITGGTPATTERFNTLR